MFQYYIVFGILSKGVELLNENGQEGKMKKKLHSLLVMYPNKATLHKLTLPSEDGGEFKLEEAHRFEHEQY